MRPLTSQLGTRMHFHATSPARLAFHFPASTAPPAARELGTHTPGPLVLQQYPGQHFKHLVHALNPAIFGQELAKAAIILALVGGVRKHVGHASKVPIRGDIHVLLVGDPGLGKSQLLQVSWASKLSDWASSCCQQEMGSCMPGQTDLLVGL